MNFSAKLRRVRDYTKVSHGEGNEAYALLFREKGIAMRGLSNFVSSSNAFLFLIWISGEVLSLEVEEDIVMGDEAVGGGIDGVTKEAARLRGADVMELLRPEVDNGSAFTINTVPGMSWPVWKI